METYINEDNLQQKTKEWLRQIEPYNVHKINLNVGRSALLVIDMQKYFLNPNSTEFTPSGRIILKNIKKLIDSFRSNNSPVIFTKHAHHKSGTDAGIMKWWWEGMCIEGTPESEVAEELSPLDNERQIIKRRYSAFFNTDLDIILRSSHIEELVICGIMTNMCCESTARDAYFRNYKVFFLADATGSITEEMHLASLLNLAFGFANVTTTELIIKAINYSNNNF